MSTEEPAGREKLRAREQHGGCGGRAQLLMRVTEYSGALVILAVRTLLCAYVCVRVRARTYRTVYRKAYVGV